MECNQWMQWRIPCFFLILYFFQLKLYHKSSFGLPISPSSQIDINSTGSLKAKEFLCSLPNNRSERIHNLLRAVNKAALKSIQSPDGDIIDCVPIEQQPAFDHPKLKLEGIKRTPVAKPHSHIDPALRTDRVHQTWSRNESCPVGTVPIRRTSLAEIQRAKSINMFGRKPGGALPIPTRRDLKLGNHEENSILVPKAS
eukprot:c17720_g2_i2 orf=243-836(+)